MVLAGANFSLYFALRHRSGWRTVAGDPELRAYLAILGGATLAVAAALVASDLYAGTDAGIARALLDALFQVASITSRAGAWARSR